jgi:hypothetical protein
LEASGTQLIHLSKPLSSERKVRRQTCHAVAVLSVGIDEVYGVDVGLRDTNERVIAASRDNRSKRY